MYIGMKKPLNFQSVDCKIIKFEGRGVQDPLTLRANLHMDGNLGCHAGLKSSVK